MTGVRSGQGPPYHCRHHARSGMLRLSPMQQGRRDASVGRKSYRTVPAVLGAVGSVRVRSAAAAMLLVLAAVMPAFAASQGDVWLDGAKASPTTGTTTTSITFSVTYHSQEKLAPAYVRLNVAGATHAMAQSGSSTAERKGVAYSVTLLLPAGSWPTEFVAANQSGAVGSVDGPTVAIQGPSPTPTPAPTPTPTPRPTPTPAPSPTPTPAPTPTPEPTPTPRPTPAPAPTPEPSSPPDATPVPTAQPAPSATDQQAPAPTALATPTSPTPTTNATPTSSAGGGPAATSGASPFATAFATTPASPLPTPTAQTAVLVPPVGSGGAGGTGTGGPGGAHLAPPTGAGSAAAAWASPFGGSSSALAVLERLAPTMIVTTGGVAMSMAFLSFGRRRRDEAPTAPDDVLAAAAASGMPTASGANLVPATVLVEDADSVATAVRAAAAVPALGGPEDTDIPRWRRQSLLEARKADPARTARTAINLTFTGQAGEVVSGLERRRIRYRLVSLLDQPDDVRGVEIGSLDAGDEVVLLERLGTYWRVLCPDGRQGWLHKMVLGTPAVDAPPANAAPQPTTPPPPVPSLPAPAGATPAPRPPSSVAATWTAGDEGPAPGSFEDILRVYTERRQKFGDA